MFKNVQVSDLVSEEIYNFGEIKSLYKMPKNKIFDPSYFSCLQGVASFAEIKIDPSKKIPSFSGSMSFLGPSKDGFFYEYIDSSRRYYSTVNGFLPLIWLGAVKLSLIYDRVPSNFREWAIEILEWFDPDRYEKSYALREGELYSIKSDLYLLLPILRSYPANKILEPLDPDGWGASDYLLDE